MSIGYNNSLEYKLDDNEYCYVMCEPLRIDSNTNPKTVFVPTLMADPERPGVIPGIPIEWIINLNDSIYCNDKECKPVVDPTIFGRNYLVVWHHANDWYFHRWLDRGARLLIEIHNKDMDHVRFIDHEDPSYCDDCQTEHPPRPWYSAIYRPQ